MKVLILVLLTLTIGCSSTHKPYVKIGTGYKSQESQIDFGSGIDKSLVYKISCQIELGVDYKSFSYGIRHVSQCFVSWPFNNKDEYAKDELFLDYKYIFKKND